MKKKIAVLISGQMRSHLNCSNFIDQFFRKNFDTDVYISTWDVFGISIRFYKYKNLNSAKDTSSKIVSKEYLKDIFKTNYIKIEKFVPKISNSFKGVKCPYLLRSNEPVASKSAIPMFYKIYDCYNMKKNNVNYDLVVRLRPDLYFKDNHAELLNFFRNSENDKLYFSSFGINKNFQLSDRFAFGSNIVMRSYCNVWNYLNDYWKNIDYSVWEKIPVGERLMFSHFKNSTYETKDINLSFEMDYD